MRVAERFRVLLPPIEEQRRIAAILDKADELRAKRRAALAHLDTLTQSIFLEMFGDWGRSSRWPLQRLNDVVADVRIGPFGSSLHNSDYASNGVPVVNPMHISDGQIMPDPRHAVGHTKAKELGRWRQNVGDVVLGRRGEMGRCAVVTEQEAGYLCGSGSMVIEPNPRAVVPSVLQGILSSDRGVSDLTAVAQGVTMLNLNSTVVRALRVPVPPLDVQLRFVVVVDKAEQSKSAAQESQLALDALFASLQQRAFAGEL